MELKGRREFDLVFRRIQTRNGTIFQKKIFLPVHCRRTCLYTSLPEEVFDGIALRLGNVMKIFISNS